MSPRLVIAQIVTVMLLMPLQAAFAAEFDARLLNISIVEFDPGIPEDKSLHRDLQVYPRIREIEALFLPFVLREVLVNSGKWGAVRVVPSADLASEMLLTGTIVHSDGDELAIAIKAADATGRIWLDREFRSAAPENYDSRGKANGTRAYQSLYDEIAMSLWAAGENLDGKALADIINVSTLRYAGDLAPSAFGDYLAQSDDGTFKLVRLPAQDDPMLERIERIRRTEYVITDAVDEKFRQLNAEIASIYDLWREQRRKSVEYQVADAQLASETKSTEPRGSYLALKNLYDNYKRDRVIAQEQDRLAVAFNNEVGAKVTSMEERVAELRGWVETESREWNRLLEELFELETGLAR